MSNAENVKMAFSIKEAVEATGYSRSYLYTQMANGRLEAYRRGGRVFITEENLRAMIEEDAKNVIDPAEFAAHASM